MALGARKGEVLRLMMRQSSAPVIYGLLAGGLLAICDFYLLRKVLYGVGPLDALSYTSFSALFPIVVVAASYETVTKLSARTQLIAVPAGYSA